MSPDRRQFAPSAARNAQAIIDVLAERLPERGRALEIASGTGQHVVAFARAFPAIRWQPSDPDPASLESITAWLRESGLGNIAAPLGVDVLRPGWHERWPHGFDVLFAANLIHISSWATTLGLMRGAGALLNPGGLFCVYGCFKRDGAHVSESNVRFDAMLRREDPSWGVRDVAEVTAAAEDQALALTETIAMPANNFSLVFRPAAAE